VHLKGGGKAGGLQRQIRMGRRAQDLQLKHHAITRPLADDVYEEEECTVLKLQVPISGSFYQETLNCTA